jgi:hypothetical protein
MKEIQHRRLEFLDGGGLVDFVGNLSRYSAGLSNTHIYIYMHTVAKLLSKVVVSQISLLFTVRSTDHRKCLSLRLPETSKFPREVKSTFRGR